MSPRPGAERGGAAVGSGVAEALGITGAHGLGRGEAKRGIGSGVGGGGAALVSVMAKPLVITVAHGLGRDEAKRRIARGMEEIGPALPSAVGSLGQRWEGDRLHLRADALGQAITGRIDVLDALIRIEID